MSVVIPCFNRSDLLRRAIESVLRQTVQDFELIVGDDGSTEDLQAVAASFGDSRIRVARRDINGGIGAGRNVAVAQAVAPLLSFLDSDDVWLPHLLETQLAVMLPSGGPAACTTGYLMRYASGREEVRVPVQSDDLLDRTVHRSDLSAGTTMMMKAEALRLVGPWREDLRRYEDYEWFLRFALAGLGLVVNPVVAAVVFSNDLAHLDVDAARASAQRILELHGAALRMRDSRLERGLRASLAQEVAWAGWRSRRPGVFLPNIARALALDPRHRIPVLIRAAGARAAWRRRGQPVRR